MTIPHLMNCRHRGDGWCLDCVKRLHDELEQLRFGGGMIADISSDQSKTIKWALERVKTVVEERDRLKQALSDIEQRLSTAEVEGWNYDQLYADVVSIRQQAREVLRGDDDREKRT